MGSNTLSNTDISYTLYNYKYVFPPLAKYKYNYDKFQIVKYKYNYDKFQIVKYKYNFFFYDKFQIFKYNYDKFLQTFCQIQIQFVKLYKLYNFQNVRSLSEFLWILHSRRTGSEHDLRDGFYIC